MTFSELKQKDVVNVRDGRRLGKPMDLALNENACVEALIVPISGSIFNLLRPEKEGCVVPWSRVLRIGDDVILVEISESDYPDACCDGNST